MYLGYKKKDLDHRFVYEPYKCLTCLALSSRALKEYKLDNK